MPRHVIYREDFVFFLKKNTNHIQKLWLKRLTLSHRSDPASLSGGTAGRGAASLTCGKVKGSSKAEDHHGGGSKRSTLKNHRFGKRKNRTKHRWFVGLFFWPCFFLLFNLPNMSDVIYISLIHLNRFFLLWTQNHHLFKPTPIAPLAPTWAWRRDPLPCRSTSSRPPNNSLRARAW